MKVESLFSENLISSTSRKFFRGRADPKEAVAWQEGLGPQAKEGALVGFSWPVFRGTLLLSLVGFVFVVLFSRTFVLQVVEGARNRSLSDNNRLRIQVVRAPRGVIYDREGAVLASSIPGFRVVWKFHGPEPNWERLSQALGISGEQLLDRLEEAERNGLGSVVIKSNASRDEILGVETAFAGFPGLVTEVFPVRYYPYGSLFAHVLGFTGQASGDDYENGFAPGEAAGALVGKGGLEREYDFLLRGREGRQLLEVNVLGNDMRSVARKEAEKGNDLRTSLDIGLQQVAYDALYWGMERSGASGGAVVAEDPRTGELLTLLSLPSFDPNRFVSGLSPVEFAQLTSDPRDLLFNRVVSGTYPPGSVFKLVTASAALETGIIAPQTTIDCQGGISVGAYTFRGWKPGGHGPLSLPDAIGKSCDVYFYVVGGGYGGQRGVGVEEIARFARLYGLGEASHVEQPLEARGLVPSPEWKLRVRGERWYVGNTYHLAIGQGDLLATPLQITNLVATIAGGGKFRRPTLLLGGASEVLREGFVSAETLGWVKEGMTRAVRPGGTAYPFFTFPVPAAGKTGTSETGRGEDTHAWFVVFAPLDNPEIVLTVFLENGGEGSHDAAPIARKILDWYFDK